MIDAPDLLTVEEAARYLRIGRTKAYAMTREWRDSGGRSGLPVAEIGNVLRVPRRHLEQLIEMALVRPEFPAAAGSLQPAVEPRPPAGGDASRFEVASDQALTRPSPEWAPQTASALASSPASTPSHFVRRHARPAGQFDLFSPAAVNSTRSR